MCDWCRESLPPASSSVTDMNGNLKFCTFLCLNKYKMNLFCTEAQQHLPRLQKEMLIPSPVNKESADKKLLITPDLWLSDGNSSDHTTTTTSESMKRPKLNLLDARGDKQSPTDTTILRDSDSKSSKKFTPPPPLPRDFLRNGFPSKCSNGINTRKRHKTSSNNNIPDSSSEFTKRFRNDSREETRNFRPANKSAAKSYEPKNPPKPPFPNDDAPDGNNRGQYSANMWMNNPNLPFLFLPPWFSGSLSNPGLANILPHSLFPTMQNFQNIQLPPVQQTQQHATRPQHQIPSLPTSAVPYPFIIPIPIPVPIIIPANIQKSAKQDANVEVKAVLIEPEVIKERFSPADDSTCSSYNQAIDFSVSRNKNPKQDPATTTFSSNSSPLSSKSPQFTVKIKTEPEEPFPVHLAASSHDMRPSHPPSYASRRSLILDAPPPSSQSKTTSSTSFGYIQTTPPKRFSHNRKRCTSAQIRSK